jgi:hypothetical protein
MTTIPNSLGLADAVEAAHEHVRAALDDAETSSLVAVAWAATHLAAVERTLYPAAARTVPDGRRLVRSQLGCDRRLHQALWRLDRRLTGDANASPRSVDITEDEVRRALRQHAAGERSLVGQLERLLDVEAQRALAEQLDDAVLQAPSRPHPNTPHLRLTGGALFKLDALVDRWRDLMESRPESTPRRRRPARRPGRWGSYLMAMPYPDPDPQPEQVAADPERG